MRQSERYSIDATSMASQSGASRSSRDEWRAQATTTMASVSTTGPSQRDIDWIRPRRGLARIASELRSRPCRIAYFGASVTAQRDGYRIHLHEHLRRWSGQEHRAIQAAVGGVGSATGVFLMDELVSAHTPDLCVVEFTTGDSADDDNLARAGQAAEGILRKLAAIHCATVVVHGHRNPGSTDRHRRSVAVWEEVAEHYGVPSLHLHEWFSRRFADRPQLEQEWFRDVVHTTAAGAATYAAQIHVGLQRVFAIDAATPVPPRPVHPQHCADTVLVPVQPHMADAPERCGSGRYRWWYPWVSLSAGNAITFACEADIVGLLVVVGSDSGFLDVHCESGSRSVCMFDEWCHYDRLHSLLFAAPGPHRRVRIEVRDSPVDVSIARRPIEDGAHLPRRLRAIAWMVRRDADRNQGSERGGIE